MGCHVRYIWDTDKARQNEAKHSITFQEAVEFLDSETTEIPLRSKGERRFLAIARIRGEYLSVIYTKRNDALRIISARHPTKKGRAEYERDHNREA